MQITSPERRWRAAAAPLIAAGLGWVAAGSFRHLSGAGVPEQLPLTIRLVVTSAAVATGAGLALLIARTHLDVGESGLADHRLFRVVHVPWEQIAGFDINRPGALWGGFCVSAMCRDGGSIDLMSTRAYSRIPSARHVDELHRICWTLEEAARQRAQEHGPEPQR